MPGDFRLVVSEVPSVPEAPALESILPGKWWELFPASCIPEGRADVRGLSPSLKLSPAREHIVRLETGTCPGSEIGRGSGGHVIDLVRTYPTQCSSV